MLEQHLKCKPTICGIQKHPHFHQNVPFSLSTQPHSWVKLENSMKTFFAGLKEWNKSAPSGKELIFHFPIPTSSASACNAFNVLTNVSFWGKWRKQRERPPAHHRCMETQYYIISYGESPLETQSKANIRFYWTCLRNARFGRKGWLSKFRKSFQIYLEIRLRPAQPKMARIACAFTVFLFSCDDDDDIVHGRWWWWSWWWWWCQTWSTTNGWSGLDML